MRACAILLESMVLSLWLSSGRTMPATISSRISKLTRISCLPSTTRLPFGSTCVTTAATLVFRFSVRATDPLPSYFEVESVVSILPGRILCACVIVWAPMKSLIPESSLLVRSRLVSLLTLALSEKNTVTVRMSPMRAARWSLKKARLPFRHSELALYEAISGFGIGICTGLYPGCDVGFSIAASFGCSPICEIRSIAEQPQAAERITSSAPVRTIRLLERLPIGSNLPPFVIARLDRAIQYSEKSESDHWQFGLLDAPLEPVIGLAEGETRWRGMTEGGGGSVKPKAALLDFDLDMNIERYSVGATCELLPAATATGAAVCVSFEPIDEDVSAAAARGVATATDTWPRPVTTPDTVRFDCRLSTLTTSPSVPPSSALPRMVR